MVANPKLLVQTLIKVQSEEDTIYEQDILREPGSIKPWLAYIDFKRQHGSLHEQAFVLERACMQLPRSYKLWKTVPDSKVLDDVEMLTVAVSHPEDKASRKAKSCYIFYRIFQGQCSLRESSDSSQQDASNLGNVSRFPDAPASSNPHATHLRSSSTRIANHSAQQNMGPISSLRKLGVGSYCH